jgi:hypothetical protein
VRFEIFNEYLFDTSTAFEFTHRCVDPGSPGGYGTELSGGTTPNIGNGAATWDPYPGAVAYRLVYTPGFGTILGNFATIPQVFGVIAGENCSATKEKAAYRLYGGAITFAPTAACDAIGFAYTQFILYAVDSNGNLTLLNRREI